MSTPSTVNPTPIVTLPSLRLAKAEDTVDSPTVAYQRMAEKWALIDALLGGTRAMRAAGKIYLPQEQGETDKQYGCRIYRSFLYEALSNTIKTLGSKPFSRPATVTNEEKFPEQLQWMFRDVNYSGCDLTQFARSCLEDMIGHGKTHILIDYPRVDSKLTLEDERKRRVRPTLIHIPATDVIGWKSERTSVGLEELTEIRIREVYTEDEGTYGQCEYPAIRIYTRTSWNLQVQVPKKEGKEGETEWVSKGSGTHELGAVPIQVIYAEQTGFMTADPPLEDLAWINLCHWQSFSDQRNILRFARAGLLFIKGVSEEDLDADLAFGPAGLYKTTNTEADVKFVEHTGASIAAGRQDLQDLEARMEVLGLQPLTQRTGGVTATGRAIDEARSHSLIQAWIRALENGLKGAILLAAKWIKAESQLPEEWQVQIYSDFGISTRARDDMLLLLQMRLKGQITHELFLREMKRRALLADDVDIEAQIAETEAAQAALLDSTVAGADGEVTGSIGDINSGKGTRRSSGRKKRMKGVGGADSGASGGDAPGTAQGRGGVAGGSPGAAGA